MSVIGRITQQPAERIDYDIDCSDLVGTADSVLSVAVLVTPAGLTVNGVVSPGGAGVKLWIDGGAAGTAYKVEATVTTTLGRIKQDELKVKIKDF